MTTAARACPSCRTPLPDEAHFCLHCGTATPTEPGVPPRTAATDVSEIARVRKALATRGYTVERVLGEGGMATVYLATDVKHRRQVAVKVMRPELAATLGAERFLREVEIAAQLNHPNVLPVHDSGNADGVLFYVMPFVDGESLHDRIKRETQLPVEEALRIAREVAEALAYAHGRKIVHRDIKPANIMLTAGHALVADFGIARAVGGGSAITQTGFAVGTPQYMSPEQASGSAAVDGRSDVFALGCVVYEMLAGEAPFTGPTPQAIVTRSMTESPRSLTATREGVSPAIEAVVTRALTKNPADRWQTAADFARALGSAEDQVRLGPISGARATAPFVAGGSGPSVSTVWTVFGAAGGMALVIIYGLVRRWGLPVWALGLAVLLLAIGALVLLVTGKMEARRAAGGSGTGLARLFTWRTATLGGVAAFGLWVAVATALVYRGPAGASSAGSGVRLAVLPFDNRGAPDDNYFVDGVADQVRGKLMGLKGFQVTARASSDQYKGTKKTPQQIGSELGVDYLLTSTVTWAKTTDGKGRVQVVPELIDVKTGAGTWQQSFDAALTDIFQVQGDIATQVAGALNVALAPNERQEIAERPTQNLAAYDLFLKAKALTDNDPASLRQSVAFTEQAVALDSTFADAWIALGVNLSLLYFNSTPDPDVAARARRAVDRARALAPDKVGTHFARYLYHTNVANDLAAAEAEVTEAMRRAPNDAAVLRMASGVAAQRGRWQEALAHAEQAMRLDPRTRRSKVTLWSVLAPLRKFPEATALGRELVAEFPTALNLREGLAQVYLMQGDLASARAVIREAPAEVPRTALATYFAIYQDLYWVLEDEDQQLVTRLGPAMFDNDRSTWATVQMQLATFRGDRARALAFADTAEAEFARQIQATPNDPQRHLFRGLALATLGRKAEAIQEATLGASFNPLDRDHNVGPYYQHQLMRVYLLVGEHEKALDILETLLEVPYVLTPAWLRIDPNFAALKGNPRFEKLRQGA
ncbi:MAG: protein kinase [Geminicoccaceae bacterium]|nr:protein kinase [Geminicoccaceae bacterium]